MAKHEGVVPQRWSVRGEAVVEHPRRGQLLVWQGIPGEAGDVEIGYRGQNRTYGNWVHARRPHPSRVHPPCERYTRCGGCPWMHLDEGGQDDARRTLVREALDEEGLTHVSIGASHASPDGLEGYRHVVKVGIDTSPRGRLRLGAWGRNGRNVVPIPDCPVAAPILRKVMAALAHHAIDLDLRPYDVESQRGLLRSAVIRASRSDGMVLLTLVATRRVHALTDLAEAVARQVPEIVGVWLHINSEPGNAIFDRDDEGEVRSRPLVGRDRIEERLGDVTYRVGPGDFFQTNPAMAEVLYARTLARLAVTDGDAVVDLYCGVGGFALQAAWHASYVLGVEELTGAVERAREAAQAQKLNAEFLAGRVVDLLPDLAVRLGDSAPLVVVNPSRRGLERGVAEGLIALRPRRVAYISCNPRALARDLVVLAKGGLHAGPMELFDMFPNTPHVECLTILEPEQAPEVSRRPPRRKVIR